MASPNDKQSLSSDPESPAIVDSPVLNRGVVATFLSGLFAILPLVLTVLIVSWVAQYLLSIVGPETHVGRALESVGLQFVTDPWMAQLIGWVIVLIGVWMFGVLVRTRARLIFDRLVDAVIHRIPVVKSIYSTASQVFRMLERRDDNEMKSMSVVFCSFGQDHGAGFLCLLATAEVFRFEDRNYHVVYMPTSPVPMTGGIIWVPAESVSPVPMSAEKLMEIYFSMGILSPDAIPEGNRAATPSG